MGKSKQSGLIKLVSLLWAMLLSAGVHAGDIQVENAWVRATVPGQDSAALDMTVTSRQAATLTGVSSAAAKSAGLHSMTHENGMMKMREVKTMGLPAGKRVNLGESGYHLMLVGLHAPLKAGETVPLALTFRMAGRHTETIGIEARVMPLAATGMAPQEGGHAQYRH